ncbi:alpha/beta fold hydrolase [Pleurocapsa sp. FMAR1]|uniref:alpha/beta fold hydrolase n=1 Tax=Pleurocapsa sp. FMAR1 TaxID=3040204 RepID=UPI0029C93EDA|nr:alpha/beta hydrolase [Pleurocapsa sp. FMAR1]
MPIIKVADYNVNYQIPQGFPSPDTKSLMLLVHGAGGSSRHWLPMMSQLDSSICSIAVDLPGHGDTSGTVPNSLTEVADFLAAFLTAINIEQPICYVGQSLGGLIGLQFALSYPQQVKRLILMTTAAKIQLHPDFWAAATSGEWDLATLGQSFAPKIPEEVKNLVLNEFKHTRLSQDANDFMGISEIDLGSAIASVQIPTLILTGGDDVIISPRKGKLLAKQMPNAHLVNIADAGHYLHVEQPAKVAREIEEFCLGVSLGSKK